MTPPITSASIEAAAPGRTSIAGLLLESLRPSQWLKNGFVFAALIFSRSLTDWHRTTLAALAVVDFCLVSSAMYLANDLCDVAEDRRHPVKRLRPIASGRLGAKAAASLATLLGLGSLAGAWFIDRRFFLVVAAYAGLNLLYSWLLKRIILVDVFVVAAGFVLRVAGGGLAIRVEISSWLIACTTLLALFVSLARRRHELVLLGGSASGHRSTLANYSPYFLDQLIAIVTASTVMSYSLYTLAPETKAKFPGKRLELTIPFVLFGIFRYLYLVHQAEEGGNPTRLLLTDPVLLSVVLMWAASVIFVIYT